VIVDGHSTGRFLARAFARLGTPSVHVQSLALGAGRAPFADEYLALLAVNEGAQATPPAADVAARDYLAQVDAHATLDELVDRLAPYPVTAVVAGIEGPNVDVADALAERLGLPCNEPALRLARRDKLAMTRALAAAGVRCLPTERATDADDAVAAWRAFGERRVVVKPATSAGADDVRLCRTAAEVRAAHEAIVGKLNLCETYNDASLVQVFAEGVEHIVNFVSEGGRHVVTDVWRYRRRWNDERAAVCLGSDLLDGQGAVENELIAYARDVLDALGVRVGPSHAEIMLTPDGPVLIELGARVMGGAIDSDLFVRAGAHSQVAATAEAYVRPVLLHARAQPYRRVERVALVNLVSTRAGEIAAVDEHALDGLRTLRTLVVHVGAGDRLHPAGDYGTCPGFALLADPDPEVVEADLATLRRIEHRLFTLV
jgi:biotin carboxylase